MNTIQSGEIEARHVNGHYWAYKSFRAERKKGSSDVLITVPAGPKTNSTVSFKVNEEELMKLASWMRGESR
jgi:hypothetical protein